MKDKKKFHIILSYGLALFVFAVLSKLIADNWAAIKSADYDFNVWLLAAAFFFALLNHIWSAWLWQGMLRRIEPSACLRPAEYYRIFVKSWLGRYLPGKVWMSAGKVYLGARRGIKKKPLALSAFFELALSTLGQLMAALVFGLLMFRDISPNSALYFLSAIFALAVSVLILRPRFLARLSGKALLKTEYADFTEKDFLPYRHLLYFTLGYAVQALIVGLAAVLLYGAVFGFSPGAAAYVLGSFVVANFIARISMLAPAGLGVREGVWTALLAASLPLAIASLLALLTRIFFMAADLIALIISRAFFGRAGG